MALSWCRKCDEEVSTSALACPHCGARNPSRPTLAFKLAIAVVVVVFWRAFCG
jgi:hypothetical protein